MNVRSGSPSGPLSRRHVCRLCSGVSLPLVMRLAPTPPANAFVPAERLGEIQERFPLDVHLCEDCGHLQLLDVVDPEVLFRDYVYVSSTSPVFVDHFRRYAQDVLGHAALPPQALVVEIGSNDGTLLRFFQERGLRVLGVDPAREIAKHATEAGIETWPSFFSADLARRIRQERGPASVVLANNVFAHIDDLADVTVGVRELLAPSGIFVFEVSYLADVIEKTLFDTIYHEHLSYHSVKPLERFFHRYGLKLIKAERVASHGGSLRGSVQLAGGPSPVSASVAELTALEKSMKLDSPETFQAFAANIDRVKSRLGSLLHQLKAQGKSIAGYGAPAKATTLLFHFDLGDVLDFIVDDSPLKQNLFSPGHHVPVLPSTAIYEQRPDYLLILAWNFAQPIMKNHQAFKDAGGHFVVPLPQLEVI